MTEARAEGQRHTAEESKIYMEGCTEAQSSCSYQKEPSFSQYTYAPNGRFWERNESHSVQAPLQHPSPVHTATIPVQISERRQRYSSH